MCVLNVVVVVSKGSMPWDDGHPRAKASHTEQLGFGGKDKDPGEGERESRLISSPRSESTGGRREEREG